MLYYKFLREKKANDHAVLKSCVSGKMKFSLFTDMKDKTETFVSIDEENVGDTLKRLIDETCQTRNLTILQKQLNLVSRIYPKYKTALNSITPLLKQFLSMANVIPSNFFDMAKNLLRDFAQSAVDDIQKRIGILCITKVIDNLRMWNEYADQAKGFAIEYEDLESLFVGDDTDVFNRIREIDYVKERLPIRLSTCDFERLFFTKLKKYEFEKESRVIKVLSDSDCVNESNGHFISVFPERYIRRVIVGWNCPDKEFSEIKEIVTKQSDDRIRVVRAIAIGNHVEIQ